MKIPSQLKIGAHIFEVRLTPEMDDQGDVDPETNVIRINSKYPSDQQATTLFHEIFGACNAVMHDRQHELLESLAEQVYAVLSENDLLK